jgi:hypothetical protein
MEAVTYRHTVEEMTLPKMWITRMRHWERWEVSELVCPPSWPILHRWHSKINLAGTNGSFHKKLMSLSPVPWKHQCNTHSQAYPEPFPGTGPGCLVWSIQDLMHPTLEPGIWFYFGIRSLTYKLDTKMRAAKKRPLLLLRIWKRTHVLVCADYWCIEIKWHNLCD